MHQRPEGSARAEVTAAETVAEDVDDVDPAEEPTRARRRNGSQ